MQEVQLFIKDINNVDEINVVNEADDFAYDFTLNDYYFEDLDLSSSDYIPVAGDPIRASAEGVSFTAYEGSVLSVNLSLGRIYVTGIGVANWSYYKISKSEANPKYKRVDLFNDETISLTQSIQNVKDIAKVFTDFTKTFTLPANAEVNKLFKHYYNFDIVGGFDARLKVDALIKLNGVDFKEGKIKLEGVDLKDNKPHSYRVTFFGKLVELKDLIGDDKIDELPFLEKFKIDYDSATVKDYLTTFNNNVTIDSETFLRPIITPLITHSKRLFYDDSGTYVFSEEASGNLYSDASVTDNRGVLWNDLKYAININVILRAIEDKYGLTFSNDFFLASNTFSKLYLWMHRKSGYFETSATGTALYYQQINDFEVKLVNDYLGSTINSQSDKLIVNSSVDSTYFLSIVPNTSYSGVSYNVDVITDGESERVISNQTGNKTYTFSKGVFNGVIEFKVSSEEDITFDNFQVITTLRTGGISNEIGSVDILNPVSLVATTPTFDPTQQLPEMKVLDFLTGLFKTFNLTAYYNGTELVVKPLNDYYNAGNEIEITKYVDVNSSKVDVGLPYNEIEFKFAGEGTFLASKHRQLFNRQFGGLEYNGNSSENWVGNKYTVEAPFERVMFEDLVSSTGFSSVKYGYIVNENQEPYIGEPIMFFARYKEDTVDIKFRDNDNTNSDINDYWIPSNSEAMATSSKTIFFGAENDIGGITLDNSLFKNYYEDYIKDVFNEKRRITKIKAFLPLKVLLTYTLADVFIINGKKYKINSITSNLQTGESDLELLNEV